MNDVRLVSYFERLDGAPDASAKLRRFILELAVQGRLVKQDPRDEPAAELLKRIASSHLIDRSPASKAQNALTPPGWSRVPLISLGSWAIGSGFPKNEQGGSDGPYLFIKVSDMNLPGNEKYISTANNYIDDRAAKRIRAKIHPPGTIVFPKIGGAIATNKRRILSREAAIDNNCLGISFSTELSNEWAYLLLSSIDLSLYQAGTAMPALQQSTVGQIPVGVPPLNEQHRIVAKVDELMALCDQLEKARAERETKRDKLTAATLARLNTPDPETFRDDARFAIDNLRALTTRPDQIKQLRQTILSLAVRGKLTTQTADDEPAAELLKRIALCKLERMQTSGDTRIKATPDPSPDALPIALPTGWSLQSFDNLFLFVDYRGKTPEKTSSGIPLITAKNIRMGTLNREPREYIAEKTYRSWMTRGFPRVGDLLFTTEAPLANVCLNELNEPFALAQRAICLQPYGEINTRFLMLAIMSDVVQSLIEQQATGMTAKGIKAANLKPLPIPIPPLSEQQRIVDKVASLFELCDQLESAVCTASTAQSRLLDVLIASSLHPRLEGEDTSVPAHRHQQRRAS